MKLFTKKESAVEEQIERLKASMDLADPASEEYKEMAATMETLYNAKNKDETGKKHMSPDVVVAGVFSLAQIGIVLAYEHLHPIVSKAFSNVWRNNPRV